MVEFTIRNLGQGGTIISEYKAIEPQWSYKLKGIGDCSWRLALSQTDVDDLPIFQDEFAPKRTDFLLLGDNEPLMGGRLLDAGLTADHGVVECSGKDWLEYMLQPFPFDYTLTPTTLTDASQNFFRAYISTAGTNTTNILYNITLEKAVKDLIAQANSLSDIQYSSVFTGTGWTQALQYVIHYLDDTDLLAHIDNLSALFDPLGFDYWCDWDKTIHFYMPRLVASPSSVVTLFDLTYGDPAMIEEGVVWHNGGPKATRTVAKTSSGLWSFSEYVPSSSLYRPTLEFANVTDQMVYDHAVNVQHIVDVVAEAQGRLDRNPQKDLTLILDPLKIFPTNELAGFINMVGEAISYDSGTQFMPYHRINADYFVVSQTYTPTDEAGNYKVELGCQQIYTT